MKHRSGGVEVTTGECRSSKEVILVNIVALEHHLILSLLRRELLRFFFANCRLAFVSIGRGGASRDSERYAVMKRQITNVCVFVLGLIDQKPCFLVRAPLLRRMRPCSCINPCPCVLWHDITARPHLNSIDGPLSPPRLSLPPRFVHSQPNLCYPQTIQDLFQSHTSWVSLLGIHTSTGAGKGGRGVSPVPTSV